jgi:PadR family transcriptional regulator, regulatory protein PadR
VTTSIGAKFQKDLNSGTLALVLLATLASSNEDLYGYDIARRLRSLTADGEHPFAEGSLYPILRNLSAAGLLTSRIVPSYSGPPRRYYRITELGRDTLLDWSSRWNTTSSWVDRCLNDLGAGMLERS